MHGLMREGRRKPVLYSTCRAVVLSLLLFNGALECRLYEFRMVAGSNRT